MRNIHVIQHKIKCADYDYEEVERIEKGSEVRFRPFSEHFDNHLSKENQEEDFIDVTLNELSSARGGKLTKCKNQCVSENAERDEGCKVLVIHQLVTCKIQKIMLGSLQ